MSDSNDKTRSFSVTQTDGLRIAPDGAALGTAVQGAIPSRAADRVYQFAALTVGVFLLATML